MLNNTWAVLATGPSLTQADVDYLRGKCRVVAVSNAYTLAPWADALVSCDEAWWQHYDPDFAGDKWVLARRDGCRKIKGIVGGSNSGLAGIHIAVTEYGATRVILLGFDLGGTHFFGEHPTPLKNTTPSRFQAFKNQLRMYHCDAEIFDCTPNGGSHFQKHVLVDIL